MKKIAKTTVDALCARRLGLTAPFCDTDIDRKKLEQAQMAALRETLAYAKNKSPYYQKSLAGLEPESLLTKTDLSRLPLLSSQDIITQGPQFLATSQSQVSRIITLQTSGTTGQEKRFYFSRQDIACITGFFQHGMRNLIEADDQVLVLLPSETPASTGAILLDALHSDQIFALGHWPPPEYGMVDLIQYHKINSVVGLPQHLLPLSQAIPHGIIKSMLLCSDYASPLLRKRIEQACGCETFLHYGATESGLGGAVECRAHSGCHIRESDLLVEIIDPVSEQPLPDGQPGEIVLTTLQREAMPLIRYRTGDIATLDHSQCSCGGITARLCSIKGRMNGSLLANGAILYSQDLDDVLFSLEGILDYRVLLEPGCPESLIVEYRTTDTTDTKPDSALSQAMQQKIHHVITTIPAILENLRQNTLQIATIRHQDAFLPSHTLKRTIIDHRKAIKEKNHALPS